METGTAARYPARLPLPCCLTRSPLLQALPYSTTLATSPWLLPHSGRLRALATSRLFPRQSASPTSVSADRASWAEMSTLLSPPDETAIGLDALLPSMPARASGGKLWCLRQVELLTSKLIHILLILPSKGITAGYGVQYRCVDRVLPLPADGVRCGLRWRIVEGLPSRPLQTISHHRKTGTGLVVTKPLLYL